MNTLRVYGITEVIKMDPKDAVNCGNKGEEFGFGNAHLFVRGCAEDAKDIVRIHADELDDAPAYAQWSVYDENDEMVARRIYTLVPEKAMLTMVEEGMLMEADYVRPKMSRDALEEAAGVTLPKFFYENSLKAWKARRGYLLHFDPARAESTDNSWTREELAYVIKKMLRQANKEVKRLSKKAKKVA